MRLLMCTILLFLSNSASAIPVVGEKVVYTGQAVKKDGLYDVQQTIEVLSFDEATKLWTLKSVYSQTAEGAPMGSIEKINKVPQKYYDVVAGGLIPKLNKDCGEDFKTSDDSVQTTSTPETLSTGLGPIQACRLESVSAAGQKSTSWWALATSPWPVQNNESSIINATSMVLTIQSLTRP